MLFSEALGYQKQIFPFITIQIAPITSGFGPVRDKLHAALHISLPVGNPIYFNIYFTFTCRNPKILEYIFYILLVVIIYSQNLTLKIRILFRPE